MNYTMRFAIIAAYSSLALPASAYETDTHKILTLHAADRSVLASTPSVLSDLGFQPWATAVYNRGTPLAPNESTRDVLAFGATNEDDIYGTRALNHFYDPQANGLQGRPLTVLGAAVGNASPDFILEDRALQIDAYGGNNGCRFQCPQEFSFRKGQQALYRALTAGTQTERDRAAYLVFQNIGHVVHHIQDMAQPAHTRNDQHLHPVPFLNDYPHWSVYELFTREHAADVDVALRDNPYPKAVNFPTARHFWQTPGSVPMYKGMAEFTSNNFTSFGTQYRGYSSIRPADEFPLPDATNRSLKDMDLGPVSYPDGKYRGGVNTYIVGTVFDGYSGLRSTEMPLAARSLLAEFPRVTTNFVENAEVWKAGYKVLMPRASAFSTGMIDHFFRGRIDIVPGTASNSWVIRNTGTQALKGNVSIYAEDPNGNRSLIANASTAQDLAPGASATMTASPPEKTVKIVVAFRGKIGEEGDAQSDYVAVTGKVIPYAGEPEIVIVGNSYYSGGSNTRQSAFRWSSKSGVRALPVGAGGVFNEALGVSPDGKTVVGTTWGLVESTGPNFDDLRFVLNPQDIPERTYYNWRAVAVKWNISGDTPGAAVYLNSGVNYSAAWRTNNGGKRIDGEATIPRQGYPVPVIWDGSRNVSFPAALVPRNSLTSADGTIKLSVVNNKAVYTQNGVVKAIPLLRGHDISVATQVVIVK